VAATAPTPNGSTRKDDTSRVSGLKAQAKLEHLEELIKSIAEQPPRVQILANTSSPPVEIPDAAQKDGTLQRVADGGSYLGSTHWSAVLQNINELKSDLQTGSVDHDDISEPVDFSRPDALFGGQRPPSLHHVLKRHLPDRIHIDRRISQYFNAKYMIIPFIHMKQFRRQYEEFWRDPSNANVVWISQMFSICCLAASLSLATNKSSDHCQNEKNTRESFEVAAGQCLLLGNYSKPQPYVIEALALFLQCKYASSLDPSREVALIFSMQTRLAYMMGYHRDGSNFPGRFTPFQAEMRRRTWAALKQFDLMAAFQFGIPSNVTPGSFDTANPSNLLDVDFDEDTKELPPSRPEHELTQTLYFVVKSRIVDVFAKICQHAISFPSIDPTVAEIMALDAQVRQSAETIPEALRIKPIAQSITDQGYEIMVRLNISFLWRKALCVLHRKYMIAKEDTYSYDTCVESASAMCASIIDIYSEFQPGGNFENDGWMLSSFTIVDYLLAIMVLCLAMSVSRKNYVNAGGDSYAWLCLNQIQTVLEILDTSRSICAELGQRSREAKRVSRVLSAVLDRLRTRRHAAAAGVDGANYFLNMSNGTIAANDNPALPAQQGRSSLSMMPLSLQDRRLPVQHFADVMTPGWGVWDKPDGSSSSASNVGRIDLSPSKSTSIPSHERQDLSGSSTVLDGFPLDVSGSQTWNMATDFDPLSYIMDGLEGPGWVDWTQLDQFTGLYGSGFG